MSGDEIVKAKEQVNVIKNYRFFSKLWNANVPMYRPWLQEMRNIWDKIREQGLHIDEFRIHRGRLSWYVNLDFGMLRNT
jgi:hypothetical protein